MNNLERYESSMINYVKDLSGTVHKTNEGYIFELITLNEGMQNKELVKKIEEITEEVYIKYKCEKKVTHIAAGFEGQESVIYAIVHDRKAKGKLQAKIYTQGIKYVLDHRMEKKWVAGIEVIQIENERFGVKYEMKIKKSSSVIDLNSIPAFREQIKKKYTDKLSQYDDLDSGDNIINLSEARFSNDGIQIKIYYQNYRNNQFVLKESINVRVGEELDQIEIESYKRYHYTEYFLKNEGYIELLEVREGQIEGESTNKYRLNIEKLYDCADEESKLFLSNMIMNHYKCNGTGYEEWYKLAKVYLESVIKEFKLINTDHILTNLSIEDLVDSETASKINEKLKWNVSYPIMFATGYINGEFMISAVSIDGDGTDEEYTTYTASLESVGKTRDFLDIDRLEVSKDSDGVVRLVEKTN